MKRAVGGIMAGLFLMGLIAAFSGAAEVEQSVESVQQEWVRVQSLPRGWVKSQKLQDLRTYTDELARRYPDNPDVRQWRSIVHENQSRYLLRRLEGATPG